MPQTRVYIITFLIVAAFQLLIPFRPKNNLVSWILNKVLVKIIHFHMNFRSTCQQDLNTCLATWGHVAILSETSLETLSYTYSELILVRYITILSEILLESYIVRKVVILVEIFSYQNWASELYIVHQSLLHLLLFSDI